MSIIMKNVKSITLGGVSVKKIEDSNNRIIWSVSSTPYRKLDYIKFSGNEYVYLNNIYIHGDTSNYEITFEKYGSDKQVIVGVTGTDRGWDISTWGENLTIINSGIYSNLVDNGKYKVTFTIGSSYHSTPISGNVYDYQNGTTKNFSRKLSNQYAIYGTRHIGCAYNDKSSTTEYYFKGRLCEFNYETTANVGGIKKTTLVPCQRKSDNVCGLYDTTNNLFFPMEGTVITDGARGNVVDENWDVK